MYVAAIIAVLFSVPTILVIIRYYQAGSFEKYCRNRNNETLKIGDFYELIHQRLIAPPPHLKSPPSTVWYSVVLKSADNNYYYSVFIKYLLSPSKNNLYKVSAGDNGWKILTPLN